MKTKFGFSIFLGSSIFATLSALFIDGFTTAGIGKAGLIWGVTWAIVGLALWAREMQTP